MPRYRGGLVALVCVLLVGGCTSGGSEPIDPQASTALPDTTTTVIDGVAAAELALATSRALYVSAPAVVLVAEDEVEAVPRASDVAVTLGVPLLVTPAAAEPDNPAEPDGPAEPGAPAEPAAAVAPDSGAQPAGAAEPDRAVEPEAGLATGAAGEEPLAEIGRLGARWVITAGTAAAEWARSVTWPPHVVLSTVENEPPGDVVPPPPLSSLLVLAQGTEADAAAVTTARAAGARVLLLGSADPRATSESVQAIAAAGPIETVLALGSAFGPAERLRQRIATAATGVELPGGGQVVFPGRRMVALYGHPGDPGLGVLGEQPVDAAVVRAQQLAASYQALVGEPVVPAFEIIVTVAAGATGSMAHPVEKFRPWVEAAGQAGVYVVLDLQPGDQHFLAQARLYEELLRHPHVGLALDPEWRIQPGRRHMVQIGSVDAAEINEVGQWLAQLTRDHHLPQKVLMLHQFRLDMIANRSALVTDYDELRVVIHADGFGSPGAKHDTWNTLRVAAPANIAWGWKNFYDEDKPTFSPLETLNVSPEIVFVSYQ